MIDVDVCKELRSIKWLVTESIFFVKIIIFSFHLYSSWIDFRKTYTVIYGSKINWDRNLVTLSMCGFSPLDIWGLGS